MSGEGTEAPEGWIYIYTQIANAYIHSREKHDIVKQLYCNEKVCGMLLRDSTAEGSEVTSRFGNVKIMCVLDKKSFKGLPEMKECLKW